MLKTLRFGIEIETVGLGRERLARAIHGVVGGTTAEEYRAWRVTDTRGRIWRVVPDASLSGGEYSGEIVSPILRYEDIEELQNIIRAVRNAGGRVDASCGIHLHLDASRFNASSVINLVKLIHKQERLLEHALGVSEARLGRYCRPIDPAFMQRLETRRPKTMQELSDAWYGYRNPNPQRYDISRYYVKPAIMWRSVQATARRRPSTGQLHIIRNASTSAVGSTFVTATLVSQRGRRQSYV